MHEMKWSEGVRTREETRLQLPDKVLRLIGHTHRKREERAATVGGAAVGGLRAQALHAIFDDVGRAHAVGAHLVRA